MLNLTRKFLNDNIQRCRDTIKHYEKNRESHIAAVGHEPEVTKDVLWARAQLDAYVRVANFMNDDVEEVNVKMTNEEACRTATELFINESLKESFDWFGAPTTIDETNELIDKTCNDKDNITKGFVTIVYFWYNFQRKKNK